MTASATAIFDFLNESAALVIERHEVSCPHFRQLRRAIRLLVKILHESEEPSNTEIAVTLRTGLFRLLSSPVHFNTNTFSFLYQTGSESQVRRILGEDAELLYRAAIEAAGLLAKDGSRLRDVYLDVVRSTSEAGETTKIYCHRQAVGEHGVSDGKWPQEKLSFLHSLSEYRDSQPFDTLIKVGPLRGKGWGAVPDALVTAARFSKLKQIVWEGCYDEPEFGLDPAIYIQMGAGHASPGTTPNPVIVPDLRITRHSYEESGSDPVEKTDNPLDEDDFAVLSMIGRPSSVAGRAVLVQIDEHHGIFYHPRSKVLSLDPEAGTGARIGLRIPGATLEAGMMIIRWVGDEPDGGTQNYAGHGYYSRIWKQELKDQMLRDEEGLIRRLHREGLDLVGPGAALAHWIRDPSTVIHAPQQKRHFEILIRTLGIQPDDGGSVERWTRRAWSEIGRTRGEAIVQGRDDHANVEHEIMRSIAGEEARLTIKSFQSSQFTERLTEDCRFGGQVMFFRVMAVELGYSPPDSAIRVIIPMDEAEKWLE